MSGALGPAVLEEEKQQWLGDGARLQPRDYADATAREVDLVVRSMLEEAGAAARNLLHARIDDLRAGAHMLMERETITPDDFPPLQQISAGEIRPPAKGHAAVSSSSS